MERPSEPSNKQRGACVEEFVFMFKYIPKCTHGRRTIARKLGAKA
jgi:hypothetical protein